MRHVLGSLLALVLGVAMLSPRVAAQELNLFIWSEYIDPELVEAFEQQTGAKVNISLFESTEQMMAKLQAAGGTRQFDLVVASNESLKAMIELKLVQPIDASKIPNLAGVMKQFRNAPYDPEGRFAVPYQWGTVGLMWDSEKITLDDDVSWQVIFGGDAPGSFILLDTLRDQIGVALKFLGHSANSTDLDEVRAAGRLVLDAKKSPRCVGFDGSVGGKNKVLAGQAALAVVYNGEALRAQEEKDSIRFDVPSEGGLLWVDLMLVTSGARNVDTAHQFMNFILDPANNAKLSDFNMFATPVEKSLELIDEEARTNGMIYPDEETMARMEFLQDVGAATRLYDEIWTAVKSR
jgi:spermidine/putrescine transport system substrate-binding protein